MDLSKPAPKPDAHFRSGREEKHGIAEMFMGAISSSVTTEEGWGGGRRGGQQSFFSSCKVEYTAWKTANMGEGDQNPAWVRGKGLHTLRRVQAIAETDDAHPLRFQHPVDLWEHLLWLLEILHADTAHHGIKGGVCCRPAIRLPVQIPHEIAVQSWVLLQLQCKESPCSWVSSGEISSVKLYSSWNCGHNKAEYLRKSVWRLSSWERVSALQT